ncbi:MAG: LamG-like jellyroll fold domain-containing protein [Luteolibacter sp.]
MNEDSDWITRCLEGEMSAEDAADLRRQLEADPAMGEAFTAQVALHGWLGPAMEGEVTRQRVITGMIDAAHQADRADFLTQVRRKLTGIRRRKALAWVATAAAAVLVFGLLLRPSEVAEPLATMTRIASQDPSSHYQVGHSFGPGDPLKLHAGLVELDLQGRGTMVVEGPAELEFTGPLAAAITKGRVVLHVNPRGHGYRLESPRGSIVDLGTTFGVSVDPTTGEVETHVIEGEVKTLPNDGSDAVLLRKNEAMRLGADANVRIPMNAGAFYAGLPPSRQLAFRMVHWPMDIRDARGIGTRTIGFGDEDFDLRFPEDLESAMPAVVDGPFGNALHFDGHGRYAESRFRGIEGAKARTVAFWAKVPEDFDPGQGYSMLSWGKFSLTEPGTVWQVSVNPDDEDGPVGRLRVGVHGGKAIGITDLRDGQWHHLAVVLYEAPGQEFGKNVLLFVNGEPEPLSSRVLGVMDTQVEEAEHGVWLGRDVTSASGPGRFFRGGLDEVYIFDAALTQGEIRTLMERNEPPR